MADSPATQLFSRKSPYLQVISFYLVWEAREMAVQSPRQFLVLNKLHLAPLSVNFGQHPMP